ncbi:triose-phosphate isomerase [uncultured Thiothrix sp.]|jgi:triosephosphate isomerase|uniref:triose-phosphate isomerase n=1 Tax=uncultured Thiothrix sp. TaxID=223185 RepID=UPI00262AC4A7|nr:triose-phosphate isomerase [uncultured Thiothrix sp.]HMT91987.1 triose-phosphate isomerase [Thiolinea sp.]
MRRILVAGNWKLNGNKASIQQLVTSIVAGVSDLTKVSIAVCAPYVYLPLTAELLSSSAVALGAQDVSEQDNGAFTGEVSAPMLLEVGCQYVIVGHSERRSLFGEKDADTARKFVAARKQGLIPILCLGESLTEREAGQTEAVVARQLDAVLALESVQALNDAVIAYEPVWAIGTGKTASPEQAQAVHAFIRERIAAQDAKVAAKVQILYGGSVKSSNAAELFAMQDIDGGLIGGASLDAQDFLKICQAGQNQ